MYALADRLKKTVGELVRLMTPAEVQGWIAYTAYLEKRRG
jgi:hypothetical protein